MHDENLIDVRFLDRLEMADGDANLVDLEVSQQGASHELRVTLCSLCLHGFHVTKSIKHNETECYP